MARCSPAWFRRNWIGQSFSRENVNINVLTSEKLTDLGNSATFYSVLVEVGLFQAGCAKSKKTQADGPARFWTLSAALPYNCGFP